MAFKHAQAIEASLAANSRTGHSDQISQLPHRQCPSGSGHTAAAATAARAGTRDAAGSRPLSVTRLLSSWPRAGKTVPRASCASFTPWSGPALCRQQRCHPPRRRQPPSKPCQQELAVRSTPFHQAVPLELQLCKNIRAVTSISISCMPPSCKVRQQPAAAVHTNERGHVFPERVRACSDVNTSHEHPRHHGARMG